MPKVTGFAQFLQKIGFVDLSQVSRQEDEAESEYRSSRQAVRMVPGKSSVFEDKYNAQRPNRPHRPVRNEKASAPSKKIAVRDNALQPRADTKVYYLTEPGDCKGVIMDIINSTSAIVNLDNADDKSSQRIIDILSGASFALEGCVRKISNGTYLIAPKSRKVIEMRPIERRY